MSDFAVELRQVFSEFFHQVVSAAPSIALLVTTSILAILICWLVERVIIVVARRKRITRLLETLGFTEWLTRAGVRRSPAHFLGRIGFWILLLLFVRTGAYVFDLVPISQAIGTFLSYLPRLFAAIAILLIGGLVARGVSAVVKRGAEGAGSDVATSLSAIVYGVVMYAIVIMALSQMGIDTEVIRVFSVIVLASLGLAFSLAFGFGARTTFENVIAGYHVRRSFGVGDQLTLTEGTGTIERVTATQTFLSLDSGEFALPNADLLGRTKFRRSPAASD
ncbi:MAG: mechanosensitive ion channel [Acidimicrobiia bacterium]|nr:mechanosensitive ion channel [Acidimicrobiia bacterium]